MSTITTAVPHRRPTTDRTPLQVLATCEGRRFLRSAPFWLGVSLAGLMWALADLDTEQWSGSQYQELIGVSPALIYVGAFVSAAIIGMRDRLGDASPLADAAPLDAGGRVLGRLLGGLALVVATLVVLGVGLAYLSLNDGIVVGPSRLMPKPADLVLIPTLVALAASTGIAAGQLIRSRAVVILCGSLVILLTTISSWIFGGALRFLPIGQVNPQDLDLGEGFSPAAAPATWVLTPPGEFTDGWTRISFEQASTAWHVVYVIGLTMLVWSIALWRRGPRTVSRALAASGALAVVAGGAVQLIVRTSPYP